MTTRRLAAILAADVVGFSAQIGEDEAGTLASLSPSSPARQLQAFAIQEGRGVHRGVDTEERSNGRYKPD
jgi:hypothetical protein